MIKACVASGLSLLSLVLALALFEGGRGSFAGSAGDSITAPDANVASIGETSIVLDAAGNPVVAYRGDVLKVLHCNDPNCAPGGDSVTTPDTAGHSAEPSLVLDPGGNPVVAYYDQPNSGLKILHCDDPNCAPGGNSIVSPHFIGEVGRYPSIRLDAAGNPVVAYWDQTNGDLRILHCDDPNCDFPGESFTAPDTGGDVGSFADLVLDTAGNPVVAYHDATNRDLKLLRCNDPICDLFGESVTSPDTAGEVGFDISLALDAAGNPVVSYYDQPNGDLKLLHCNDPGCVSGGDSIVSPDTAGDVGVETSLELDPNGNPVVSYFDVTNGDLRVLHCNDSNCAGGGDSIVSPDTAGEVGEGSSLQVDAAGNPVVSYFDDTDGQLKLLHCDDPDCSPPPTASPTPEATPMPSPTVAPTATPTVTPSATATPTPTGTPGGGIQGDADCDGDADSVDALHVLRDVADIGQSACIAQGDVNCDGARTSVDSLGILRYVVSLPQIPQMEPCADIGQALT